MAYSPIGPAIVTYSPASGTTFGIGTTEVEVCVFVNGVTNCCTFDVVVNPVANPVTSLVCNDLTNISLDESCELVLTADMVLEGGPYKCYDTYIVQVDRSLPLGNGPWVTGTLTAADVHRVLAVRVVDDVNGDGIAQINENSCWGNINIEDNCHR
ncbi:MAG: hypothetical protein IPL27_08975 [Lewinellaceae bacterium]|nr:hypothetical protein [Lewinellaceae bacterium]